MCISEMGRARGMRDEDKGDAALPVTSWINSFSPLARTCLLCSNITPKTCCLTLTHTHSHTGTHHIFFLSFSFSNFGTFSLSLINRAWGGGWWRWVMTRIIMLAPVYKNKKNALKLVLRGTGHCKKNPVTLPRLIDTHVTERTDIRQQQHVL